MRMTDVRATPGSDPRVGFSRPPLVGLLRHMALTRAAVGVHLLLPPSLFLLGLPGRRFL